MKLRWYLLAIVGLVGFNFWCWQELEQSRQEFRNSRMEQGAVSELAGRLRELDELTRGKVAPLSPDEPFQSELVGALGNLEIPPADSSWSATTVLDFDDLGWQLKKVANPIKEYCTLNQLAEFLKWVSGSGGRFHVSQLKLTIAPSDTEEKEAWQPEFSLYLFEAK